MRISVSVCVRTLCASGALAAVLACGDHRAAPPEAPSAKATAGFASVPADAGGELRYDLAIQPCGQPSCPIVVQLVKADRALDSASLEWGSATPEATREEIDARWGVGDPLTGDSG